MTFLAIIVAILAIITLAQIVRVFELSGKLSENDQASIDYTSNKNRGFSWILFGLGYFAFFIYCVVEYGQYLLPESASLHGETIDMLMDFNMIIIITVFFITHCLLFFFSAKYHWKPGQKAAFISHNNKLELMWTSAPAIVLAVIIIYGLSSWNEITEEAPEGGINIELYSKQFDWTARYGGADNKLGKANYNMINGSNALGLITATTLAERKAELKDQINELVTVRIPQTPEGGVNREIAEEDIAHKERQIQKLNIFSRSYKKDAAPFEAGNDDKIVKGEIHIPVDTVVNFWFRSQDVIHSAYMPHFRAQMNTVPGMVTEFHFTPTITTKEMREKTGNPEFDYILLCNKICGAAHYNMQMTIVVETQEEYEAWLAEQTAFEAPAQAEAVETEVEQVADNNL